MLFDEVKRLACSKQRLKLVQPSASISDSLNTTWGSRSARHGNCATSCCTIAMPAGGLCVRSADSPLMAFSGRSTSFCVFRRRRLGFRTWGRQRRLLLRQLVKLVELGLQELFVGQTGLIFRDQGRRDGPAEGVLDDFAVLRGAQQNAEGWALVRLFHIAVKGLQVEFQLTETLGLELFDLQLESSKAIERPMQEEQVDVEVASADLDQCTGCRRSRSRGTAR
jgi:hypothetical protein